MMAASVVDLPEPVGPVTSTNPRGLWQNEWSTLGSPRSSMVLMLTGTSRKAAASVPLLEEGVHAEARHGRTASTRGRPPSRSRASAAGLG